MEDAPAPTGGTDFPVTDHQRQAAVNHLDGEFARGALDPTELQRRKDAVLTSSTVAQLLAATAEAPAPVAAATVSALPARRTNVVALVAGLACGALLLALVASRLVT